MTNGFPLWARKYLPGFLGSQAAGTVRNLLELNERCLVRLLSFSYDGDDTTGTSTSILTIIVDDQFRIRASLLDIFYLWCAGVVATHSDRPVVYLVYDATTKAFRIIFHDIGLIKEKMIVRLYNADTTNAAVVRCGCVYDVEERE